MHVCSKDRSSRNLFAFIRLLLKIIIFYRKSWRPHRFIQPNQTQRPPRGWIGDLIPWDFVPHGPRICASMDGSATEWIELFQFQRGKIGVHGLWQSSTDNRMVPRRSAHCPKSPWFENGDAQWDSLLSSFYVSSVVYFWQLCEPVFVFLYLRNMWACQKVT